jgi:hypothetical protein
MNQEKRRTMSFSHFFHIFLLVMMAVAVLALVCAT